jgi:hypothetical protein
MPLRHLNLNSKNHIMDSPQKNSKKLKIAVQVFGHMRTFEKCAPSLKKYFLRYYDCDIFIQTWSTLDHKTKTWHKRKTYGHSIERSQFENKIQSLYNTTKTKIEDQVPEDLGIYEASSTRTLSIYGIQSMFYSMEQVNKLREVYECQSKTKYDYVLMIRPDILLKKRLRIEQFTKLFSEEETTSAVFSAGFNNKPIINELRFFGAIDVMFFAKPQTMTKLLNDHQAMTQDAQRVSHLKKFGPEYLLYRQAASKGIDFNIIDFKMNESWEILRLAPYITRKKIISLRIKKDHTDLVVLGMMPRVFQISIKINMYTIRIAIGG